MKRAGERRMSRMRLMRAGWFAGLPILAFTIGCTQAEPAPKSDATVAKPVSPVTVENLSAFSVGRNVLTLPAVADAGIRAGNRKDENLGQRGILEVKNFDDTPQSGWVLQRVLLKFDLKGIDPTKIRAASLCLYGNLGDGVKPVAVELYPIADQDDGWEEDKVNWNNQPPAGEASIGQIVFTFGDTPTRATVGRWYISSDIAKHLREETKAGNKIASLLLKTSIREEACLFTKEHAVGKDRGPRLIIEMAK